MGTRLRAGSLAVALFMAGTAAQAQDAGLSATPMVGSRIRFSADGLAGPMVQGQILAEDAETWTVVINGQMPLRVRRDAIRRLDISTARPRQWRRGLIVGAAVGAAMFAIIGDESDECRDLGDCYNRAEMTGAGALGGALWGLGIGALVRSDQWARVSNDGLRLSVAPTPGRGVKAALSIGF
ncbi:MAG TPA: hypothetical protein VF310_04175 [Vicinamibacteria bacterium]